MNPRGFMRAQVSMVVLTSCLLAFSPARLGLWLLAAAIGAAALVLAGAYRHKLANAERADDRVSGDREVVRQVALIILAAVLACAVALIWGKPTLWQEPRLSVGAVAFACFWGAVYIASLFDWYYIRSRRDGVVVPPPCKPGQVNWTNVTRAWWTNRCLVVLVCYLAGICSVVAFGLAALGDTGDSKPAVGSVVVATVVAATTVIKLFYGNLGAVGAAISSCVLSPPDIALGDRLTGPDGFVAGYVWNIALEGITIVLLDPDGKPRMKGETPATRRYPLAQVLGNTELETQPYGGCASTCLHVNPECQWIGEKAGSLHTAPA